MKPLARAIEAVLVNTNDPAPLTRTMTALGWVAEPVSRLDAAVAARLFGVDSACEITVLGSPGVSSGRIIACRWPDLQTLPEGPRLTGSSLGLFSIDLYVHDMEECRRRTGAEWTGDGSEVYEFGGGGGSVRVEEGLLWIADRVPLVPVRAERPRATAAWAIDPARPSTELTSVVLATDDVDRAVRFLGPAGLGLPLIYDAVIDSPALARMIEGPAGSAYRLAFLGADDTARVEIIARQGPPAHADDVRERQRPARATGIFGWVVEVTDLERALAGGDGTGEIVDAFGGRAAMTLGPDRNLVVAVQRDR